MRGARLERRLNNFKLYLGREMSTFNYPLEELMRIKQKRLEEAEKVFTQKKEELKKEEKKQKELEEKRDETASHREEKLGQLRSEMDLGSPANKIEKARDYIKVVDGELELKNRAVTKQIKEVESAKENVKKAREELRKKEQDIEKLKTHRGEWQKEMKALEEHQMTIETDELGSAMHNIRKFKEKG